jgi:hypothetical protein
VTLERVASIFVRQNLRFPHAYNLCPAEIAFAVRDVHAGDRKDVAFDDGFFVVGAPGCPGAFEPRHVADINVMQPFSAGGVARLDQRLDRCGRQVSADFKASFLSCLENSNPSSGVSLLINPSSRFKIIGDCST